MDKPSHEPSFHRKMPRAAHPTIREVCSPPIAKKAYKQANKGRKRMKRDAVEFNRRKVSNMNELTAEMLHGTYTPGGYMHFILHDKKTRPVDAPYIRDKIAQSMLHEALLGAFVPRYVKTIYACLPGRGNLAAAFEIQRMMQLARLEYGPECWILKIDVRHYYYRMDHDILKSMLARYIDDQTILSLLCRVIDNSPPMEEIGKGSPLGNVTSQDFANLYLTPLDKCAVRFLGVKYYGRYADDIVAILPTKDRARAVLDHLRRFAADKLKLEFNEKTQIFPLRQGVASLGFKIRCDSLKLSEASKKAQKRRLKKLDEKVKAGIITEKEAQQQVSAWLGFARWGNNFNLCKKLFEPYPYLKFEDPKFKFGDKKHKKRLMK